MERVRDRECESSLLIPHWRQVPRTRVGPTGRTEVTHEGPRGRTVVSESGATYTSISDTGRPAEYAC